jgi:hypothetical protein
MNALLFDRLLPPPPRRFCNSHVKHAFTTSSLGGDDELDGLIVLRPLNADSNPLLLLLLLLPESNPKPFEGANLLNIDASVGGAGVVGGLVSELMNDNTPAGSCSPFACGACGDPEKN